MAGRRTVPVRILEKEYRIRSDADDETVRRAASLVDETMTRVQKRTGTIDTLDVAVLAALNIANRLVAAADAPGVSAAELRPLVELIEAELVAGSATSH